MKLTKKNWILVLVLVVAVISAVIVAAVVAVNKKPGSDNTADVSPSPTFSLSPSPTPTQILRSTAKPTPGIIVEELPDYYNLAVALDKENRYFALGADCNSIRPSNIAYKNNIKVMFDNVAWGKARILKIGDREYSLEAHGWILATLSSPNLPVQLKIFCGSMELGQIELN